MASLWQEQSGRHSLAFDRPRKIWKTWSKAERLSSLEKARGFAAKAGNSFRTFGPQRRNKHSHTTDIHSENTPYVIIAESPEPPDGLGGR